MNVHVTGGTGFVGREVVRELHTAGHRIHLLVRNRGSRAAQQLANRFGAELREADLLDAASLVDEFRGSDAVIHLVGIISEVGDQTFENVHTRGTQNIIAAAQQAGVKRLVHMSALGVRPDAVARYHRSKWAAEEIVRNSGLDWTIFRPSIIYGAGDGFVNLFARISRLSPIVPLMGTGRSRFQPIAVESVAQAFVKSLDEQKAISKTFDLCVNEVLTLSQIIDAILHVTRCRRLKLRVPFPLARLQAAILEFVFPKLLGKAPPLNRDQLLMLQEDNVGNAQPAMEMFNLKTIPFSEGIARYLRPS